MQKAGKYEIVKKIGAGGFGVVFEGRDPFIKRRVAIKTCTTEDADIRQRFFREAEIAGNLQHRNIVTIHDFGFEDGVPYLVQEYLPGEDLSQIIARNEPIGVGRKLDILFQVAQGLAYAQSQNVIHRDIKPGNIRVLEDWRVKIMDFGIAKLAHVESALTKEGMTVGTAAYLPPEQIRGEKVDSRADVFSFGVLAYELLTYRRPFDGKTLSTLLYQILSQEPRPLAEVWPEAPPRVAKLVGWCLEKEAARRCNSFERVAEELQAALAEAEVIESTNLIPQQRPASVAAPPAERPTEMAQIEERVRRALDAGNLTGAELELTLAQKSWRSSGSFAQAAAPLREQIARARAQEDDERRSAEKLRLLLERGRSRLDLDEFAEARMVFEAALDIDPGSAEGADGIARADAGIAWQAEQSARAAQASERLREASARLASDEPEAAADFARRALELQPESVEAQRLLGAAEERIRARAEEEERRREEERRQRAEAEAARVAEAARARAADLARRQAEVVRRIDALDFDGARVELDAGAAEHGRAAFAALDKRLRAARHDAEVEEICAGAEALLDADEPQRAADEARRALALDGASSAARELLGRAEGELRRRAEAEERERKRQALAREVESLIERGALAKAAKALTKGERDHGADALADVRARLDTARQAVEAHAEAERAAKNQQAEEERAAKRQQAEETAQRRERQAAEKADRARARHLEATAGEQVPSSSFAPLASPRVLGWAAGGALALVAVAVGLVVAFRGEPADRRVAAAAAPVESTHPESAPTDRPAAPATLPESTGQAGQRSEPERPKPAAPETVTAPPPAPRPAAVEPPAPVTVEAPPPKPAPHEVALASARAALAGGDRRGAMAALLEARRLAPGDGAVAALLGNLRRAEQQRLAAARARAVRAGAERHATEAFGAAEREAARLADASAPTLWLDAADRAVEQYAAAGREAAERQQVIAATPALPQAPPQSAPQTTPAAPVTSAPEPASPASVAPAAPAPAAAQAAPDPATAVKAVLERYRAAHEALDAAALRAVWPSIGDDASRQIARAFAGYNALSMTFDRCEYRGAGDRATATCKVTQSIDPKVGSRLRSTQEVVFELRRTAAGWVIESRSAR